MVETGLDYEELLAKMEQAEQAPAPGSFIPFKEIIHKGDESLPIDIVTGSLKDAGWVYVYHTATGERRVVNRNMLPAILKKKLDNGQTAFSTRPILNPPQPVVKGKMKCWLHKNSEHRQLADTWGFQICPAGSLRSPMDVERHMQHRHKQEYATIKDHWEKVEKDEEREWRRALVELAKPKSVGRPKKEDE